MASMTKNGRRDSGMKCEKLAARWRVNRESRRSHVYRCLDLDRTRSAVIDAGVAFRPGILAAQYRIFGEIVK